MSEALDAARSALGGERAWLVGGAVRDRLLGRASEDVDLVLDGDVAAAAKALGRAVRGPAFELSDAFGAWRVIGPGRRWQVDLSPLQGADLEEDLRRRDLTLNAIAEPLAGGAPVDPTGGIEDLRAGVLRMVAPASFDADPLRTLRVARFATELGFAPEPATAAAAAARAPRLAEVSPERIFAELKRIVAAPQAVAGLRLCRELGLLPAVLPELDALRGVEQNRYHHLDVFDHTLEVLGSAIELERDPGAVLGPALDAPLRAHLAAPFADELTAAGALRFGALLHDAAKPQTQARDESGAVLGFPGHAEQGAAVARRALARLRASERLRAHAAALTRHHLRLGFLIHQVPLDRRAIHRYLVATRPVEVDVSLLSVADRLATRGRKADEAIERHLDVARTVLPAALAYAAEAAAPPLVRGDVLAAALGIAPGPALGPLLAEIAEARYAGEVATVEEAVALARRSITASTRPTVCDTDV